MVFTRINMNTNVWNQFGLVVTHWPQLSICYISKVAAHLWSQRDSQSSITYVHITTARQKPCISNCSPVFFRDNENRSFSHTKACNPSNEFTMSVTTIGVTIVSPNIFKINCLLNFIMPSFCQCSRLPESHVDEIIQYVLHNRSDETTG